MGRAFGALIATKDGKKRRSIFSRPGGCVEIGGYLAAIRGRRDSRQAAMGSGGLTAISPDVSEMMANRPPDTGDVGRALRTLIATRNA